MPSDERGAATASAPGGAFALDAHRSSSRSALGAATVAGFAPFDLFPLPVAHARGAAVAVARAPRAARRPRRSAGAFGLGFFLAGVSWVYVSLHDFGAMPAPLAARLRRCSSARFSRSFRRSPATAVRALARAARGSSCARRCRRRCGRSTEWLRGWIFTGFPWLARRLLAGAGEPARGLRADRSASSACRSRPSLSAGLLAAARAQRCAATRRPRCFGVPARILVAARPCRDLARRLRACSRSQWTQPRGRAGHGQRCSRATSRRTQVAPRAVCARRSRPIAQLALASDAQLIVLPETALPLFLRPGARATISTRLAAHARAQRRRRADRRARAPADAATTTTAWSRSARRRTQTYRKSHLVPFGEFIPLRPVLGWIVSVLAIPLQDFSRGAPDAAAARRRRAARRGQHLLRGRVRRGDHPPAAGRRRCS